MHPTRFRHRCDSSFAPQGDIGGQTARKQRKYQKLFNASRFHKAGAILNDYAPACQARKTTRNPHK